MLIQIKYMFFINYNFFILILKIKKKKSKTSKSEVHFLKTLFCDLALTNYWI